MWYKPRRLIKCGPEPVGDQLRKLLIAEIEAGTFLEGTKLPTERALAEKFGTSRTTVRQAIASLAKEGSLILSPRKGVFVRTLPGRAQVAGDESPRSSVPSFRGTFAFVVSGEIFKFVELGVNRILLGAQGACQQNDLRLLFHTLEEDSALADRGVAGYIVVGGAPLHFLQRLREAGTPFVLVDLLLDDRPASVGFDYAGGMRQAVTYLHGLGHRDIGFVGFPNSEKYVAFWQTLAALGMRYEPQWSVFLQLPSLQSSMLSGYRAIQAILATKPLPTAMIATNDLVALGICDALTVAGIEVPQRMSVMGFDDLGADAGRPLTTMRTDSAAVGRLAVRNLLELINGGAPNPSRISVPTELIIRDSTGPVYQSPEAA